LSMRNKNGKRTWFGIGQEDLSENEKSNAKLVAHSYLIVGVLLFWTVSYVLYYRG